MLPALENIPHTPEDWNRFAFDHRDSHNRIRAGILKKYNIALNDYPIDPINPESINNFLEYNSQLHGDMNGVLKLQSSDLEDINLQDEKQLASWIRLHYLEHYYAESALGV